MQRGNVVGPECSLALFSPPIFVPNRNRSRNPLILADFGRFLSNLG